MVVQKVKICFYSKQPEVFEKFFVESASEFQNLKVDFAKLDQIEDMNELQSLSFHDLILIDNEELSDHQESIISNLCGLGVPLVEVGKKQKLLPFTHYINPTQLSKFELEKTIQLQLLKGTILHEQEARQRISIKSKVDSEIFEMIKSIAHEINTPLSLIYGLTEKVMGLLGGEKSKNHVRDSIVELNKINSMVERIDRILKGFYGLYSQRNSEEFEKCQLNKMVREALEVCSEKIEKFHIVINARLPSIEVECKPTKFVQVLSNLINNAIDATKHLDNPEITIEGIKQEDTLRLQVSNNGIPITENLRDKIFQAEFTTKKGGKHFGLGLSICRKIAMEHMGSVELYSNDPVTFEIKLPLKQNKKDTTSRILIVEDHLPFSNFLAELFKSYKLKVTTCRFGKEAMNAIKSNDYELIICDLDLPDMYGLDLFENCSKDSTSKFLFMTGYSNIDFQGLKEKVEPNLFYKPFDSKAFLSKAMHLIQEKQSTSA